MHLENESETSAKVAKSTTIQLSINPDYVRGWGLWEALREFVQNGLDAHDRGHPLTLTRGGGEKRTIRIVSEGTVLRRESLLLGMSDKQDGGSRGKFGEGYKLGLLVATRLGIAVQIRTGNEMWTSVIERSDQFGADCLKVRIATQPTFVNRVEFQVHGITDEDWTQIRARLVLPEDQGLGHSVGMDRIIPDRPGELFNRGIYVCRMVGTWRYGFDLYNVELDRDRKAPDSWSLKHGIMNVLSNAIGGAVSASALYDLLNSGGAESELVASALSWQGPDAPAIVALTDEFERRNPGVVPVKSSADAITAGNAGLKSAVVGNAIVNAVEVRRGKLADRAESNGMSVREIVQLDALTATERENLEWALDLVRPIHEIGTVSVGHFVNPALLGLWRSNGEITLSVKCLETREQVLCTLCHEIAHAISGPTHEAAFAEALGTLMASIVTKNVIL